MSFFSISCYILKKNISTSQFSSPFHINLGFSIEKRKTLFTPSLLRFTHNLLPKDYCIKKHDEISCRFFFSLALIVFKLISVLGIKLYYGFIIEMKGTTMFEKPYPIEEIRSQFPSLKRQYKGKQVSYFDGPGGSQIVQGAIDALVNYVHQGRSNVHGNFITSKETDEIMYQARLAMADFVGAYPEEVAFGPNSTTLVYSLSRALGRHISPGDEIVVSELDHHCNIDPWVDIAVEKGAIIRWIKLNVDTLELDLENLNEIINSKTKIVAIGYGSNGVGTITDVAKINARAHEVNAITVVDAVHGSPHRVVDRNELGADIIFLSAYKFFGPFIGAIIIKKTLFENLRPYKVKPASNHIPENFETGTQNHEGLAGLPAVINFIASLGTGETRREKVVSGMERVTSYENHLANKFRNALKQIPEVKLFQASDSTPKTPTIAFRINSIPPAEVCIKLCEEYSILVGSGHFYALTIGDLLDLNSSGGWIRVGISLYTLESEIDQLILALKSIILKD